ncbi:hypothetical protein DQ04_18541000, partial [Trypanosoma grayi]|uniref:hypothetical protein n=1 Tax=Trypanosoma grayi TaxID=71804 RepID=UPI0004F4BCAF
MMKTGSGLNDEFGHWPKNLPLGCVCVRARSFGAFFFCRPFWSVLGWRFVGRKWPKNLLSWEKAGSPTPEKAPKWCGFSPLLFSNARGAGDCPANPVLFRSGGGVGG